MQWPVCQIKCPFGRACPETTTAAGDLKFGTHFSRVCSTDRTDQNENRTGDFTYKNALKKRDTVTLFGPSWFDNRWAPGGI